MAEAAQARTILLDSSDESKQQCGKAKAEASPQFRKKFLYWS